MIRLDGTFAAESRAIAAAATNLPRCIVPLFRMVDRTPRLCGTGFLVSSEGSSFLVSAAHVLENVRCGSGLFFYIDSTTTRKLSGTFRLTEGHADDRIDVGVLRLEGHGLPPYVAVDRYPLKIEALQRAGVPRDGKQYLVVGFPESHTRANPVKRDITSRVYSFRNISAPAETYAKCGVAPETHIVLSFDEKKVLGPDGRVRAFANPVGMSGSPVWLFGNGEGLDPSQLTVVGIAIEHFKVHRAMVCTDIGFALTLIREAF